MAGKGDGVKLYLGVLYLWILVGQGPVVHTICTTQGVWLCVVSRPSCFLLFAIFPFFFTSLKETARRSYKILTVQ